MRKINLSTSNPTGHLSVVDVQDAVIAPKSRLNARHYEECVTRRGLDRRWVEANCSSIDKKEASHHLGYEAKSNGVLLKGVGYQIQFRPDKPWKRDGDKKAPKYRTPLGEYDVMLPINPDDPHYWDDLEALKAKCYQIDGHPCINVTEGGFKAIAGCSNGFPTIALLGVEQGLTSSKDDPQGKRYLVAGLEMFARAGIGFNFCFDADSATNQNVVWAQIKLAHQIKKFGVPQYSVTGLWSEDQGKGMDDYIQKNGADQFHREVLARAIAIDEWEKQFKSQEDEKKIISQLSVAREIAGDYRTKLAWNIKTKAWYWYEFTKKGVWSEIPDEEVNAVIIAELEKRTPHGNFNFVAGIAKLLKAHLRINHWEVRPGFVCLEDCVIEVSTGKEYPHEPGYRFLSSLPYKWGDRCKGCAPIKDWLLEACEGRWEWIEVLRAAIKATVCERGGDLQRLMELVGFGGTGKGTILRLVMALVGKENCAVTDLKQLENNRFETASFYGKKAVLITDSERYTGDISNLKRLTGDDPIRYEKKGVQQTEPFRFKGVVWIATNSPIQSSDYTSGLRRRRLSMGFNRVTPPHLRRDLENEFKPYLPGLLAWVIEMPDEAMFDYFRNTDTKVPSLASFNAETLLDTNPIAEWVDECLIIDPDAKTYVGNKEMSIENFLYANYYNWARVNGSEQPIGHRRFSSVLLDLLKSTLGLVESVKAKDSKGAYLTGVKIRLPGLDSLPRPITGDGRVTDSDGSSDDSVMDKVMVETLTNDGLQQNDGKNDNSDLPADRHHHHQMDDDQSRTGQKNQKAPNPSLTLNPEAPPEPLPPIGCWVQLLGEKGEIARVSKHTGMESHPLFLENDSKTVCGSYRLNDVQILTQQQCLELGCTPYNPKLQRSAIAL